MRKTLLFILCLSIVSLSSLVYADSDSINSSDFVIRLAPMDPLHPNNSSPSSGIEAFRTLLGSVTSVLLIALPMIAAVSMIIAGYFYIFSAGDSEKAGRAKTIIKWNIVAITVALLSFSIVKLVAEFFKS